jgi:hypothetical protein
MQRCRRQLDWHHKTLRSNMSMITHSWQSFSTWSSGLSVRITKVGPEEGKIE